MSSGNDSNPFAISISDLMAGMVMFFFLICIFLLFQIVDQTESLEREKERAKVEIAKQKEELESKNNSNNIFVVSEERFKEAGLNVKVDPRSGTYTIDDELLFDLNNHVLKTDGRKFLDKFIPILASVLFENDSIRGNLLSIDIEGYSSEKKKDKSKMMDLSLRRSISVWNHIRKMGVRDKDSLVFYTKVCGYGNVRAKSEKDQKEDRKVIFRINMNVIHHNERIRSETE